MFWLKFTYFLKKRPGLKFRPCENIGRAVIK